MKKVLMIAYDYPPLGGGGVFRTLKFTKYLPQFGFRPYILTVKNPMYVIKDPTLLDEIPPEVRIFRTFSFEHRVLRVPRLLNMNLKWFYIPDENIGWLPFAVHAGLKIVRKEDIDLIFATSPIWTALLAGHLLKRKTGKPLVIDFRDPWTKGPFASYPTNLHKCIEEKMEQQILMNSDFAITVSDSIKESFTERYPFLKSRVEVITNGFDPDDFINSETAKQAKRFTIVHTGSLYGRRTAKPFLLALKELVEEKAELVANLEVLFIGNFGKEAPLLVKTLGLGEIVKLVSYVSHKQSLKLMLASHALLLLITEKGLHEEGTTTGKLFEYIASRRPIIAVVPEMGAAAEIIESLEAGEVVPPNNIQLIKQTIIRFYDKWKSGKLARTAGDINKFDRRILTQRLSEVFEKALSVY